MSVILTVFIIAGPQLFEYRDEIRGAQTKEVEMEEFILGKVSGRLSNLTALLIFNSRYEQFSNNIYELHYMSYFADTLKYFWGGFTKNLLPTHYDYFTSVLDPNAMGYYAMMTGTIPALGLSYMMSPMIMLFDLFVTYVFIIYTLKLSTYILGSYGKILAFSMLIFAVLSGAPGQFSILMINLTVILILIKTFNILFGIKQKRYA
jgi:ABC-type phosphate/phosphonate transport system permease subunit